MYEDDDDDDDAFPPVVAKKKNDAGSAELVSIMEDVKGIHCDLAANSEEQVASWTEPGFAGHLLLQYLHVNSHGATHYIYKMLQTYPWGSCIDSWYSGEDEITKKWPIC